MWSRRGRDNNENTENSKYMLRLGHEKMLASGNTLNYFLVIRAVTREETRRRQKMSLYLILTNVPESKKTVVIWNNVL